MYEVSEDEKILGLVKRLREQDLQHTALVDSKPVSQLDDIINKSVEEFFSNHKKVLLLLTPDDELVQTHLKSKVRYLWKRATLLHNSV